MNQIYELVKKEQEYIVKLRRHFHQNPELSKEEKETSAYIQKELMAMGIPFEIVGEYGVLAKIEGKNTDKMVALRGDMDALPINEENNHLEYKSTKPNVMHACGHDAHTAMLLGAVRVLNQVKDQINGTVLFCFQQAEEIAYGAKLQVEAIKKYPVKSCFGIHVASYIESGKIAVSEGAIMAAADIFRISIQGTGGHASRPDLSISPLMAGVALVSNISHARAQEFTSFEPLTICVGNFQTPGGRFNVIPDTTIIDGTIRTMSQETRKKAAEMLHRVCEYTASTYRVTANVEITNATQIVFNDAECVSITKNSLEKLTKTEDIIHQRPTMGGEDFSEFADIYPSVFVNLGTKNIDLDTGYGHHHPKFNIDEKPLSLGVAIYAQYAIDYLEQH